MENRFLRAVAFGRFCVFNPRFNLSFLELSSRSFSNMDAASQKVGGR